MKCKVKRIDRTADDSAALYERHRELQAEIARLEKELELEKAQIQCYLETPGGQALLRAVKARRRKQYEQLPLVPLESE